MAWSATAEQHEWGEALEWFQRRTPLTRKEVDQLPPVLRRRVLWFTGIESASSIQWVREQLASALSEGWTIDKWRKDMSDAFAFAHESGPSRARTVLRTNVFTAVNDARYTEQLRPERMRYRPYLIYDAVLDTRTTEICRHRDRRLCRVDDPYVRINMPPLHFQCRSVWRPLTERQAELRGGVSPLDPDEPPVPEGFGVAPSAGDEVFDWPERFKDDPELRSAVEQKIEAEKQRQRDELLRAVEREAARNPEIGSAAVEAQRSAADWLEQQGAAPHAAARAVLMREHLAELSYGWTEQVERMPAIEILDALLERSNLDGELGTVGKILEGVATDAEVQGLARALGIRGTDYGWTQAETVARVSQVVRSTYGITQGLLAKFPAMARAESGAGGLVLWGARPLSAPASRKALAAAAAGEEYVLEASRATTFHPSRKAADKGVSRGVVLLEERIDHTRVVLHPWVDPSASRILAIGSGDSLTYAPDAVLPSSAMRAAQTRAALRKLATGIDDKAWQYGRNAGYATVPEEAPGLALFRKPDGTLVSVRRAQEIATGKRTGAGDMPFEPIDVVVVLLEDGRPLMRIRSGRERIRAARLAGATKVSARVKVWHRARGAWLVEADDLQVISIPEGHGDKLTEAQLEKVRRKLRGS